MMSKATIKSVIGVVLVTSMVLMSVVGCTSSKSEPATNTEVTEATESTVSETATSAPTSDTVQVGIILPTKDEPRWIQDEQRFGEILDLSGFSYQVLFSQGSTATEKTNVETLVSKGIKVLIICPQDTAAVGSALDVAKQAGVSVIAYDRNCTETENVDYRVGFDNVSVGIAQAQYLIENATGSGNPLYLYAGAVTDDNSFPFFEGAWITLQPKIADGTFVIANSSKAVELKDKLELSRDEMATIMGQITTDWDFNKAKSKAEADISSAGTELKGNVYILAPNDGTSRSIADVFATDKEVTKYYITGQDVEVASVQYIIDGKQSMTVYKDTRELSAEAVKMASQILKGEDVVTNSVSFNGVKDVPTKQLDVISIVRSNIKEYLIDTGYYEASQFTGLE